jgi:hypothetical protein
MLAVVVSADRSMLMSELLGARVVEAELLPPADVPPLLSSVAPVVTETVTDVADVGVPVTGHEILAPMATVAGGAATQVPSVRPAGKAETEHVALVAGAVADKLFVHLIMPLYGTPTEIVVDKPVRSGTMSDATVAMTGDALLLPPAVVPPTVSLVAPVETETVVEPGAVGMPDTGQEIEAPAASDATGSGGVHVPTVTPGGRPVTEHVGLIAAAVDNALFVHNTVPA